MTIQNIPARDINIQLGNLQRCAETAPAGTYEDARNAAAAIDTAIEAVREAFKDNGLNATGTDDCRSLEAAIYWFMLRSNPDAHYLITAEGFGEHVGGPAGARVLANAIRDRDALQLMGGR